MLRVKVKAGNITNLSDARYCAGMGVDMLGFPIGGGHGAIDPDKYKEITNWVSVPVFVVEWNSAEIPRNLREVLASYNAGLVEINVHHLPEFEDCGMGLIVKMDLSQWNSYSDLIKQYKSHIEYLNIYADVEAAGTSTIVGDYQVLISGVTLGNLDAVSNLGVAGIALEGSSEAQPGLKEYGELADILEKLEV